MIAWRGSPGACHSGCGGFSSSASRPSVDEHPDERRREALGDRERVVDHVGSVERVVALVDDLAARHDDDRPHAGLGVRRPERPVDRRVDGGPVDAGGQLADRPLRRRERHARRLVRIPAALPSSAGRRTSPARRSSPAAQSSPRRRSSPARRSGQARCPSRPAPPTLASSPSRIRSGRPSTRRRGRPLPGRRAGGVEPSPATLGRAERISPMRSSCAPHATGRTTGVPSHAVVLPVGHERAAAARAAQPAGARNMASTAPIAAATATTTVAAMTPRSSQNGASVGINARNAPVAAQRTPRRPARARRAGRGQYGHQAPAEGQGDQQRDGGDGREQPPHEQRAGLRRQRRELPPPDAGGGDGDGEQRPRQAVARSPAPGGPAPAPTAAPTASGTRDGAGSQSRRPPRPPGSPLTSIATVGGLDLRRRARASAGGPGSIQWARWSCQA